MTPQATTPQSTPPAATTDARTTPDGTPTGAGPETDLVLDELLVEDVSIDGMCGVY